MDIGNLKNLSRDELVQLAVKQGVQIHWKAKPETIIKAIVDKVSSPPPAPIKEAAMEHPAERAALPKHDNKPEDVERVIEEIKARVPEFTSTYNLEENTWHFRCKGAEECGNLAIPLRIIKERALTVSRGRVSLMGLNQHFNDPGTATGKNAYTNTILSL